MSKYKEDIIQLRKKGKTYDEIEDKLECSRSTISYHCQKKELGERRENISEDKAKEIDRLRLSGKTIKEVSDEADVSESSVQKYTSEETKEKLKKERIKTGSEKRKSISREQFVGSKFHKGVVSEEKVRTKILELGYKIYEPVVKSVEDLIVETDNGFKKVQIKHGTYKNGCIISRISRSCNSYKENIKAKCYHEDDVDIFAIYCSETDKIYGLKFDNAPNHRVNLRVEPPKKKSKNIRWAEDYEIRKVL